MNNEHRWNHLKNILTVLLRLQWTLHLQEKFHNLAKEHGCLMTCKTTDRLWNNPEWGVKTEWKESGSHPGCSGNITWAPLTQHTHGKLQCGCSLSCAPHYLVAVSDSGGEGVLISISSVSINCTVGKFSKYYMEDALSADLLHLPEGLCVSSVNK